MRTGQETVGPRGWVPVSGQGRRLGVLGNGSLGDAQGRRLGVLGNVSLGCGQDRRLGVVGNRSLWADSAGD